MKFTKEEQIERLTNWHRDNWHYYYSDDVNKLNWVELFKEPEVLREILEEHNWSFTKAKDYIWKKLEHV